MDRILLIDDDSMLRASLVKGLTARGFHCEAKADAASALEVQASGAVYDLILLDVTLPDGSGWDVLEHFRADGDLTPVIFLTARHGLDDRVRGLRLGADDYVVKPFEFEELVARVEVILRRQRPPVTYVIEGVLVDLTARRATREGRDLELSLREFDLLAALIEAEGAVLDRRELLRRVWGMAHDTGTNIVDVVVMRARRKLDLRGSNVIQTVVGEGYRSQAKRIRG